MLEFNRMVRSQELSWPDNYYSETDGKKRGELIKAQLEKDDSEENRIRFRLWEKRYTSPKKGLTGVDYFLKMALTMEKIADLKDSFLGKKSFRKGVLEIRDLFCLDLLKEKQEYAGLWKDEFLNLWSLYIEVCKDDKNYTSILLGTGRMSKERIIGKLKGDIYHKTVLMPEALGLAEELTPYREAGSEAFYYYFPE